MRAHSCQKGENFCAFHGSSSGQRIGSGGFQSLAGRIWLGQGMLEVSWARIASGQKRLSNITGRGRVGHPETGFDLKKQSDT